MFNISSFVADFIPIFIAFCAVSFIISIVAIIILMRRLNNWSSPDVEKLRGKFASIRKKRPNMSEKQALQNIINQQAFKCGMVGAVTSLGGFYTLPIALPVDMVLSTQIQSTIVQFIASAYGVEVDNELSHRVRTYIVTTGSTQATERTTRYLMKFALRMSGRSFAKLIPLIGAVIGFTVNYFIAQTTARVAMKWYAQQAKQQQLPHSK